MIAKSFREILKKRITSLIGVIVKKVSIYMLEASSRNGKNHTSLFVLNRCRSIEVKSHTKQFSGHLDGF